MTRSGVGVRSLVALLVMLVAGWCGVVVGVPAAWAVEGRVPASDGKLTSADGKTVVPDGKVAATDSKMVPGGDGKSLPAETRMLSMPDLPAETVKVGAALLVLVVLAVLVVRMGRRLRPQWRGNGPIFVEDGRNLAPGVGVRLIRVGSRYWLIGVTREQVTLLGELTEEDLLEEDAAEEEEEPAVELVAPKNRPVRGIREDEPSLVDRGVRR